MFSTMNLSERNGSVFKEVYSRSYRKYGNKLVDYSKDNLNFIQRLGLIKTLPLHQGCVNTLCWNESGSVLLSGSDDQHLVVTNGHTYKVLNDYRTSHRANIFSAKFMPVSGDHHIVSCSGDGIILYTDLERPSETYYNQFNCHSGTTYEVITIPQDPNTFLSCGEDGTVRWFDLRMKNRCKKPRCKEDILILHYRAVSALCINPMAPHLLAIGSSDSTVRIFDRRMLHSDLDPPMCSFTVPELVDRTYRITSLSYSADGRDILVSYSSDHLYLFNTHEQTKRELTTQPEVRNRASANKRLRTSPPPVRRLRLRGDWSDTGPDARPEREGTQAVNIGQARPQLQATLMERMTNVLFRMLNDPLTRAALSGGGEDSLEQRQQQTQSPQLEESQEEPLQETVNNEEQVEEPDQQIEETHEEPRENEDHLMEHNSFSSDEGYVADWQQESRTEMEESTSSEQQKMEVAPQQSSTEMNVDQVTPVFDEQQLLTMESPNRELIIQEKIQSLKQELEEVRSECEKDMIKCRELKQRIINLESHYQKKERTEESQSVAQENVASTSNTQSTNPASPLPGCSFDLVDDNPSEERINELINLREELSSLRKGFIEQHGAEPSVSLHYSDQSSTSATIKLGVIDELYRSDYEVIDCNMCSDSETSLDLDANNQQDNTHQTPSSSNENPTETTSKTPEITEPIPEPSQKSQPPEPSTSPQINVTLNVEENTRNVSYEPKQSLMHDMESTSSTDVSLGQSRDQRGCNDFDDYSDADDEDERSDHRAESMSDRSHQPKVTQKYIGHRNARTMIKEATFWGNDYVMSGSDCGHVFVWDRYTAKLVMLLQADHHVVNCLQPHPTLPLLATSGIDHDVKLWSPILEESAFDEKMAKDLMERNEVMLEETRDTITVPAAFMIRMLACLNQIRRTGALRQRQRRDESESDT